MTASTENNAVKIAVRERPVRETLRDTQQQSVTSYPAPNILIVDERPFTFDYVLPPDVSQEHLYNDIIKPLVTKALEGFHCTALAYGQTGTGKSYTMGLNSENFEGDHVGVIPRCLQEIFNIDAECVENIDSLQKREISASFIEIYNEKVYDLLAENSGEPILAKGCKFNGGTRKTVNNLQECYNLLIHGNKKRHVRSTSMNPQSSRSHAMFTIHLRKQREDAVLSSCLNIVDLAGSEGIRRTGHQGMAMSEGVHINQGLLSIGKVFQALTVGQKVIPYRDSVLSSVLQDSLNVNSYLTLLACISPHREDLSETLSTLRFAQNAKQLKNTPQMNTILAEIKKNKVKTPYRMSSVSTKNATTPTPFKRPFSTALPSNRTSTVAKKQHSNTFCTPGKKKRMADSVNKCNQSEMGLTPKEKQKALARSTVPCNIVTAHPYEFQNRSSLFDHTIDSRGSLMSLNISSSTTLDSQAAPQPQSYSPVVRKCLAELETRMETKLMQMMTTLVNATRSANAAVSFVETPAHVEPSVLPATMRKELKSLMAEVLVEKGALKQTLELENALSSNTTPINTNIKCQLFTTSSPKDITPNAHNCNNLAMENSPESSLNLTTDQIVAVEESSLNLRKSISELTMMPKPQYERRAINLSSCDITLDKITEELNESDEIKPQRKHIKNENAQTRRSMRILERSTQQLNASVASDYNSERKFKSKRRSSRGPNLKQTHDARRRSIRLAAHLEVPAEETTANLSHTKTHSLRNKGTKLDVNNSIIAGYLGQIGAAESKKSSDKKAGLLKHRKGVLDLLNTGSMRDLQILQQIGQKMAYQLVTHRTLNGRFKTIAQVEKLPIWRGTTWQRFAKANMLQ